jgi:cytochrome c
MNKVVATIACALLILGFVQTAFAQQEEEVVALVEKAVGQFQEKGKDYTLKLIDSTSGPFRKGELYVYVVSFDGVALAHAANRELVGKHQGNTMDAKGKPILPELLAVATGPGSGWIEYWWMRHGEKEPTLKRTYIKRVPGEDILVAAGYYVK